MVGGAHLQTGRWGSVVDMGGLILDSNNCKLIKICGPKQSVFHVLN